MDWVTLLKGINVGGNNIVKMAELRLALADAGLDNVRTYIQSGNILCEAALAETVRTTVQTVLASRFDVTCDVVTLSAQTWAKLVETNPFPDAIGNQLHLMVPTAPVGRFDFETLKSYATTAEALSWQNNTLYLHTPDGFSRSKLAERLPRLLPVPFTARNLNTARKILALATL